MVFCGKPSGGCHACRERKTRCDQRAKPQGCTQCERAKRECPGYRVPGDVIFRNESENVKRKHKAKQARVAAKNLSATSTSIVSYHSPASSRDSQTSEEDESLEIVQQHYSPLTEFSLAPNLEDNATAFFITNYVIKCDGPVRGHLDYISAICDPNEDGNLNPLIAAMKAVGIAGVAHTAKAPSLLKNARYLYMKAIQGTNAALKSPTLVKKDSTLTAIMILSIYETVTGCTQDSIRDWADHVKGAAALLKLRGREQLKTPRGRRMFLQIVSSLMITCIQRDAPLPSFILDWTAEMKNDVLPNEPAFLTQQAMMAFTQFRARLYDKTISDPEVILNKAIELDGVFVELFTTRLPPQWEYVTMYTDQNSDLIWNGRYHIYYDYWISQVWNGMRTARIMLNLTIRDTLLEGFSCKPPRFTGLEHSAQFQLSTDTLFEMQADILYTVPQHLGYLPTITSNQYSSNAAESSIRLPWTQFSDENKDGFPILRMSGPYLLLWPLWFTGILNIATDELKQYVIRNLRTMGETMGIQQANVLAHVIESEKGITVW